MEMRYLITFITASFMTIGSGIYLIAEASPDDPPGTQYTGLLVDYTDPLTGREAMRTIIGWRDKTWCTTHDWSGEKSAFSPDSKKLVFEKGPGPNYPAGLYIADLETKVITFLTPAGWNSGAEWSKDGQEVYYFSKSNGVLTVNAVNVNTFKTRTIAKFPEAEWRTGITVSADGKYLAIAVRVPDQGWTIKILRPDTGEIVYSAVTGEDNVCQWNPRYPDVFLTTINGVTAPYSLNKLMQGKTPEEARAGWTDKLRHVAHSAWHPNGEWYYDYGVLKDARTGKRIPGTYEAGNGHHNINPADWDKGVKARAVKEIVNCSISDESEWWEKYEPTEVHGPRILVFPLDERYNASHTLGLHYSREWKHTNHAHPHWSWDGRYLAVTSDFKDDGKEYTRTKPYKVTRIRVSFDWPFDVDPINEPYSPGGDIYHSDIIIFKTPECAGTPPPILNQKPYQKPSGYFKTDTYKGPVPLTVNFDGSYSIDQEDNIVAYDWDFGDGTTGSGEKVTHTFTSPGEYPVKLRVTDGAGLWDEVVKTIYALPAQDTQAPSAPGPIYLSFKDRTSLEVIFNKVNELDVTSYNIYSSTDPNFIPNPANLVGTVQEPKVADPDVAEKISGRRSFLHQGLAPGQTYYYRVTAVDLYGNESPPSEVVGIDIGDLLLVTQDHNIGYDVAFADLNGDGKNEVLFYSDRLYAYNSDGNLLWSYDTGGEFKYGGRIIGITGLNIMLHRHGQIAILDRNGNRVFLSDGGWYSRKGAVGDFDGDGWQEVAFERFWWTDTHQNYLYLYSSTDGINWDQKWSISLGGYPPILQMGKGDFDGDGREDISLLRGEHRGHINLTTHNGLNGETIFSVKSSYIHYPTGHMVLDLNQDGIKGEIVVASQGRLSAWKFKGTIGELQGDSDALWITSSFEGTINKMIATDLDGDGYESEIVIGTNDSWVRAFDHSGNLLWEMKDLSLGAVRSLTAGDFDGDEIPEIFVGGEANEHGDARLLVLNKEGEVIKTYLFTTGSIVALTQKLADLDGDGVNDLGLNTETGKGYVIRTAGGINSDLVNRPPKLCPIKDKSVKEGETLSFTISATDPDDDVLVYSAENLPSGATFQDQTFSWTPTHQQVGIYQVTFNVSDGILTDSKTITITVKDKTPPTPPSGLKVWQ